MLKLMDKKIFTILRFRIMSVSIHKDLAEKMLLGRWYHYLRSWQDSLCPPEMRKNKNMLELLGIEPTNLSLPGKMFNHNIRGNQNPIPALN